MPRLPRTLPVEVELSVSLRALPLPDAGSGLRRRCRRPHTRGQEQPHAALVVAGRGRAGAGSGGLWLAAGGASAPGAGVALLDFVVSVVREPLVLAGWLSSAQAWADLGSAAEALLGAIAGSPAYLATCIAAAVMVAVGTNTLLYIAARRALIAQR